MPLANVINELKKFEAKGEDKVLSLYLNTDRSQCQDNSWKIRLKNGLKKFEAYIESGGTEEELKSFKKIKKRTEKLVYDSVMDLQKGLIIFASDTDALFSVHFLQVSVENEFFWENKPELSQIEHIQKTYPSSGVILANEDEVILMHAALGELDVVSHYQFEAYTDDWRSFEGVAATERVSSSATHRDHFQDRIEANQQRWLRGLLPSVKEKGKQYGWQHIHIIGQAEYLNHLIKELDFKVKKIVRKTLPSKEQNEIIYKEVLTN